MADIKEEYIVKCIEEFPGKKGHVAITLVPTVMLHEDEPESIQMGVFPKGMEPPKEVMQGLNMMIQQTKQMQRKHNCPHDCREIILIIPEIDFYSTEWHFGDVVTADFNKVKDGKKKLPDEVKK